MSLQLFKSHFQNRNSELIHLNNAGLSLTSSAAAEKVRYWIQRFQQEGMHCNDDYMQAAETARAQVANLVGSETSEIAFFQSTAGAISQIAFGLDFKRDDEILVWDQEYASNLYPWKVACDRSGAKLVRAISDRDGSTPFGSLQKAVTNKTKLIAISWVQFQTGAMTDLKALSAFARERGIWTVVDVIQGLGLIPFDFKDSGIDAICGGSHKWLVSPVGVGFLALRKERLKELKPITIGAMTFGTCDDPSDLACLPKTDATKFEAGSKQVLEITALGASCELIRSCGVKVIGDEAFRLGGLLRAGLQDLGFRLFHPEEFQQAFVNFSLQESQGSAEFCRDQIAQKLKIHKISYALRGPGVRLSTHAFNSENEIEKAIQAISSLSAP